MVWLQDVDRSCIYQGTVGKLLLVRVVAIPVSRTFV